jgi:hypothetical protein
MINANIQKIKAYNAIATEKYHQSPVGVEHLRQYFMLSTHHLETQKLYPLRFHQ